MAEPKDWVLKVVGAGSEEVNGFYKQDGERNRKPRYKKIDANGDIVLDDERFIQIYWASQNYIPWRTSWRTASHWASSAASHWGRIWRICVLTYYENKSDSPTPPCNDWKPVQEGKDPAPVIVYRNEQPASHPSVASFPSMPQVQSKAVLATKVKAPSATLLSSQSSAAPPHLNNPAPKSKVKPVSMTDSASAGPPHLSVPATKSKVKPVSMAASASASAPTLAPSSTVASTVDTSHAKAQLLSTDATERIADVESGHASLAPFHGWKDTPLLPLLDAVEPLEGHVKHIQDYAEAALDFGENYCMANPGTGLTEDEVAAIHLYTFGWVPAADSLYHILNQHLRMEDRNKLKPFFAYFRLLMEGLQKLPKVKGTFWRGIRGNADEGYSVVDKKITWWSFSSCTMSGKVLETSSLFLGQSGERTLFSIDCLSGIEIQGFSSIKAEKEVLLLPGTRVRVKNTIEPAPGLNIVNLEEVPPRSKSAHHP